MKNEIAQKTLDEKGSALPYVFGWLIGIPVPVLLLILMLRSC